MTRLNEERIKIEAFALLSFLSNRGYKDLQFDDIVDALKSMEETKPLQNQWVDMCHNNPERYRK